MNLNIFGKKNIFFLVRIFISLIFIVFLVWLFRDKIPRVIDVIKKTNLFFLLLAVLVFLFDIITVSLRLKLVFSVQKIYISLKNVIYFTLIGFFFNNFLPTSVGGDAVKAYYCSKKSNGKLISFSTVLIDRIFGVVSLIGIVLMLIFFIDETSKYDTLFLLLSIIFPISVLTIFFLSNFKLMKWLSEIMVKFNKKKLGTIILKIYNLFITYFKNKKILVSIIGVSIIAQVVSIIAVYFLSKSLSLNIPVFALFLSMPIVYVASMFPSINGLGIRESVFVFCLKDFTSIENILALSLLFLVLGLGYSLAGGIIFAFAKFPKEKEGKYVR